MTVQRRSSCPSQPDPVGTRASVAGSAATRTPGPGGTAERGPRARGGGARRGRCARGRPPGPHRGPLVLRQLVRSGGAPVGRLLAPRRARPLHSFDDGRRSSPAGRGGHGGSAPLAGGRCWTTSADPMVSRATTGPRSPGEHPVRPGCRYRTSEPAPGSSAGTGVRWLRSSGGSGRAFVANRCGALPLVPRPQERIPAPGPRRPRGQRASNGGAPVALGQEHGPRGALYADRRDGRRPRRPPAPDRPRASRSREDRSRRGHDRQRRAWRGEQPAPCST
jgi:hypothetical protein